MEFDQAVQFFSHHPTVSLAFCCNTNNLFDFNFIKEQFQAKPQFFIRKKSANVRIQQTI
jgi:hypothetical protein